MIKHVQDLAKTVFLAAAAGAVFGFSAATALAAVFNFYSRM